MAETILAETEIRRLMDRGVKFLGALSRTPALRARLEQGGYTEEDHQKGWSLLLDLQGYRRPNVPVVLGVAANSREQAQAVAALDEWDGPNFERTRAALSHHYPDQCAYLFHNLSAKTGTESIAAVNTFVDRIAALRDGTDPTRTASQDADRAAADLLARRRILDSDEEQRLRGLIATAIRLADAPNPAVDPIEPSRRSALAEEFRNWLGDWRDTARVLVTRRDHQIQLGLANRRATRGSATANEGGAEAQGRRSAPAATTVGTPPSNATTGSGE